MTEQKSTSAFDFESMRRAIEQLDADLLTSLYADDAQMHIVNRYSTPSSPRELHGKEEIAEHLKDVCGRAMTHRGTQNVKVYPAGDTSSPVIEADVPLESGRAYTIGAVGLVGDGSITGNVYQDDLTPPAQGNSKLRVVHASPDAGPVDVVPVGGAPLVSGLQFPNASPYAQVPAGTYTLNVNAAGTDTTAISVPNATVASGGVYSAFAVGTASAGNLNVILVQDNVGRTEPLPSTGGISPLWLAAGLATMAVMVYASVKGGALAVRRIRAKD